MTWRLELVPYSVLHTPALRVGLVLSGIFGIALAWRALPVAEQVARAASEATSRAGAMGVGLFLLVYVLATILMVPGTPLSLAGGYLFGPVSGLLAVWTGATVGAILAFLVARLGRRRLSGWLDRDPRLQALDSALSEKGLRVVLLLRLTPVVPFNGLNYALGLSGVRLAPYAAATALGMLPHSILLTAAGATARTRAVPGTHQLAWVLAVIGTMAAVLYLGWIARRTLITVSEASRAAESRSLEAPR